jgi:hypothetical protein
MRGGGGGFPDLVREGSLRDIIPSNVGFIFSRMPTDLFFWMILVLLLRGFGEKFGKVPIFMAYFSFEWDLFIIHFLYVCPPIEGKLNHFREAFFQINLHTNTSTSEQGRFMFSFIDILSQGVSNATKDIVPPTMERNMQELNPNWDNFGDFNFWIEVWSPSIQIHTLWPHKIGSIP